MMSAPAEPSPAGAHPRRGGRIVELVERLHRDFVDERRCRLLGDRLSGLLPANSSVLDVGCGNGLLDKTITTERGDLAISGVDVQIRDHVHWPVDPFDGTTLPFDDGAFDVVMFVDVLHHTTDPMVLLREASRVARRAVVIKDHTSDGLLAHQTLRFMDRIGNERHGVVLPYNYWPRTTWLDAFDRLKLEIVEWKADLRLYPWPASLLFDRSLHFVARLEPASSTS